ncbi:unnamed protein product, partial [marine sediment metagenome]
AIFLPPVAVLMCGKPVQAVINLFLTLLLYVPGMIHAILVVNNYYNDKRTGRIVSAIQPQYGLKKKKTNLPLAWILLGIILIFALIGLCESSDSQTINYINTYDYQN